MLTIILAAGNNKRFGGKHKAILKARDGKTILENIVYNLDADPVFIIAQKKHVRQLRNVVGNLSMLGKFRTVYHGWITRPITKGPLDTLWQAREWIHKILNSMDNGDCSIVISYCDVLLERKHFDRFVATCKDKEVNGVVVFKSENERFQDAGPEGFKKSGVFYFRSGREMMSLLQIFERKPDEGICDLVYSTLGSELWLCNEVIDIGTPEDYKEYING